MWRHWGSPSDSIHTLFGVSGRRAGQTASHASKCASFKTSSVAQSVFSYHKGMEIRQQREIWKIHRPEDIKPHIPSYQ